MGSCCVRRAGLRMGHDGSRGEQGLFCAWKDLVQATVTSLHGAAASDDYQTAAAVIPAETLPLVWPRGKLT